MRYKVAPGPVDADLLVAVRDAVPLVPGSVDDCCARILDRTAVADRDAAADWLTFCDALGLAARTDRGYRRTDRDPDPEELGEAFRDHVFLAADLLDAVAAADDPLDADGTFERVRGSVPEWERNRHADWAAVWRGRAERLLDWAVLFGLVEHREGGYAPVGGAGRGGTAESF